AVVVAGERPVVPGRSGHGRGDPNAALGDAGKVRVVDVAVAADRTTVVVDAGGDHLGLLGCAQREPSAGVATGPGRGSANAAGQRGRQQHRFLRQRVVLVPHLV